MDEPREVTDDEGLTWSCLEAVAGPGDGRVAVVCTPSGGAQSVRLALAPDWAEGLDDAALVRAIGEARD